MDIEELVETFALCGDWEDRYRYLIDLGAQLPPMDIALKTEKSRVQGCMSQVWMVLSSDDSGRLRLVADSDAQIVRGLIAVLAAAFAGRTRTGAAGVDVEGIFTRLGLDGHLSPNRRNGFFSMVERVRKFTEQVA